MQAQCGGALAVALAVVCLLGAPARAQVWIGAWGASPSGVAGAEGYRQRTFRQVVHLDGGGTSLRLRLGNALSGTRLVIGTVHVATPAGPTGVVDASTDRAVTFGGQAMVAIPAYAAVVSDPVPLRVAAGADLTVSLYVASTGGPTEHALGSAAAFVAPGDQTGAAVLSQATRTDSRIVLSGIDVDAPSDVGTVVALGDSITDGFRSTPGLAHRWPDGLARRLRADPSLTGLGVVNAGISGNRLLRDGIGPNALSRLPRDVFALPGVRFICVLEGINDIGGGALSHDPATRVTAADLIAGYAQIIAQGHEHGAKVLIGTLTPFSGKGLAEKVRAEVNAWIRAKEGFDGVLDFDAAVRDPNDTTQLLASYDSGDHLHPNDAGYAAMASAIDLALFRRNEEAARK